MTERKVSDPSAGGKAPSGRVKGSMGDTASLPTTGTLIGKFAEGSIPLAQDFSDLINIAEFGRRAVGQSTDQTDNTVGNGLALADSTIPATMGKLSVKAGAGITVDTSGVSIDPNKVLPAGVIVMFNGSTIPAGWALCDGTSSTPDLRDRFILGGGLTDVGKKGGGFSDSTAKSITCTSSNVSATGSISVSNTTLSTSQMPSHNHTLTAKNPAGGSSTVSLYAQTDQVPGGSSLTVAVSNSTNAGNAQKYTIGSTGGGSGHTHTATFSPAAHSHTTSTTVPYYILAFIIKK